MKRFMIGQFGTYDEKKQSRDFRDGFFGIEACSLEKNEDIEALIEVIRKENLSLGIHFPLKAHQWRLRDPQYLSLKKAIEEDAYHYMSNEFQYIEKLKPHYVLLHYPKPVILDDNVNWTKWRFADDSEYYYASEYPYETFVERSRIFFRWLSNQGIKHHFIPVLELDAISSYIYKSTFLEELLEEFDTIRLCLDIGRLHSQEKIDEDFDSFKFFEKYGKYAEVIHLWNVKVTSNLEYSHYPVLPEQLPSEGWADIQQYMKLLKSENQDCKLLFEHRSDMIGDDELNTCYQWVDKLLTEC